MQAILNREMVIDSEQSFRNTDFQSLQFSPIGQTEKNHKAVLRKRARKEARLRQQKREKAKNVALSVLFVACCVMMIWAACLPV